MSDRFETQQRAAPDARYRAVFARLPVPLAVVDAAGVVLEASPALERALGCPVSSLAGRRFAEFFGAESWPERGVATGAPLLARGCGGGARRFIAERSDLPGERGVVLVTLHPAVDPVEEPPQVPADTRDVSPAPALDRLPLPATLKDRHGQWLHVNPAFVAWTGRDLAWLRAHGEAGWRTPADAAQAEADERAAVDQGGAVERYERWPVGDGERDVLAVRFPVDSPSGQALVCTFGVDLSDSHAALEVERYLTAIVTTDEEAVVVWSPDGAITRWNAGAERLTGFPAEAMLGRPVDELTPERGRDLAEAARRRAAAGEWVGPMSGAWRRADGATVDVAYTLSPLSGEDGSPVAVMAIARDFTAPRSLREALRRADAELDRRVSERTVRLWEVNARLNANVAELEQAQVQLRRQAEAFREQAHLLALANDAIVAFAAEGREITYWNRAAEALYGWPAGDAVGRTVDDLLAPEYPQSPTEIRATLAESGGWVGEVWHRRADGSRIHVESRWALGRTAAGRPGSVITVNRDLTERERLLREVQANATRIEELAQMRDDFVAIAAHEMASPVAAIRWFAEVIGMGDMTPEERAHAAATIKSEADLLQTLVDDVRAVARIDRDDFLVEPRRIDLGVLVRQAESYARSLPGGHPFTADVQVEGMVFADDKRLGQVMRNLLGNAAKYTPPGTPIRLSLLPHGGQVRVEVSDEGPGLSPEDQAVVFEKYRRGRGAAEGGKPGAGIGLYVSQRIVQAHGSELKVESEPGRGATFFFDLDLLD